MLPTGHIAAGFLVGTAVAKLALPDGNPEIVRIFGLWGAWWGFAPDLDEFWFFYKNKSLLVAAEAEKYHRSYLSHAPVLWLVPSLIIYLSSANQAMRVGALVLWLASWSHFLLDSIEYGIMWLWPFSSKLFALKDAAERTFVIEEKAFFKHSLKFLWAYTKTLSFYLEVIIILTAVIVFYL